MFCKINYGYSFWLAHSWFNSYAPKLVPIFYYRNKTRVHMFYFLNEKVSTFFTMRSSIPRTTNTQERVWVFKTGAIVTWIWCTEVHRWSNTNRRDTYLALLIFATVYTYLMIELHYYWVCNKNINDYNYSFKSRDDWAYTISLRT